MLVFSCKDPVEVGYKEVFIKQTTKELYKTCFINFGPASETFYFYLEMSHLFS